MIKHYARQHTLVCTARADDLALPFQSVRLSVCPMPVYCAQTTSNIVLLAICYRHHSIFDRNRYNKIPPKFTLSAEASVNDRYTGWRNWDFRSVLHFISETVRDGLNDIFYTSSRIV